MKLKYYLLAIIAIFSLQHIEANKSISKIKNITSWFRSLRMPTKADLKTVKNFLNHSEYKKCLENKKSCSVAKLTALVALDTLIAYATFQLVKRTLTKNPPAPIAAKLDANYSIKNNINLIIRQGNIIDTKADAIVNAANANLQTGGGVCGAIFNAAGLSHLQSECKDKKCSTGKAIITPSCGLKEKGINHIIHAVGPIYDPNKDLTRQNELLASAYTNSLVLADKHTINSIAFPFISAGIYKYPKNDAANVALKSVTNYLENASTKIKTVYFVLLSSKDYDLFKDTMNKLYSQPNEQDEQLSLFIDKEPIPKFE